MRLITCIDDNNGIMFNNRRQSKDSMLRHDIAAEVGNSVLWMNAYSAKQFTDTPDLKICVDENFVSKAGIDDYCFMEQPADAPQIEQIILYKWNRVYPADTHFNMNLSGWKLERTSEFAGSSHEKITKEVYVK